MHILHGFRCVFVSVWLSATGLTLIKYTYSIVGMYRIVYVSEGGMHTPRIHSIWRRCWYVKKRMGKTANLIEFVELNCNTLMSVGHCYKHSNLLIFHNLSL